MKKTPAPVVNPAATAEHAPKPLGYRVLRYVLALITCVLLVDAFVGEKGLIEIMRARREHATLSQALDRARSDNAKLQAEARRLRHDPRAIEELARRELGLIEPGEKLFIIKDLDASEP